MCIPDAMTLLSVSYLLRSPRVEVWPGNCNESKHEFRICLAFEMLFFCHRGLSESHTTRHWWLKGIARYKPNPFVIDYLLKFHKAILASARFKRRQGQDYIWWLPHTAVFSRVDIFAEATVSSVIQVCPDVLRVSGVALAQG